VEVSRPPEVLCFGPYAIRPRTQELFKHGLRLKLAPQAFQVLRILVERPGQLVNREDLHQALWPTDTFVDFDHGLNNAIKRIRDVLNDSADSPVYIETLPRLGYRFILPVTLGPSTRSGEEGAPTRLESIGKARRFAPVAMSVEVNWKRYVAWAVYLILLAATILVAYRFWPRSSTASSPARITQISHWNKPMEWVRLSPDGHSVAFVSPHDGTPQVFLMLTSGGGTLQLTNDGGGKVLDNFSADGTEIYYIRSHNEIWAVPTLGGAPRRLLSAAGAVFPSRDGTLLYYTNHDNTAIFRAGKSGLNEELLYRPEDPTLLLSVLGLFPDGNNLLISSWHFDSLNLRHFSRLNLTSHALVDLGQVDRNGDAGWDEPGASLLFSRRIDGLTNLWKYELKDRRLTQLTFGTGPDRWPLRDPGGKGIYYVNGKTSSFLTAYHVQSKESTDIVSDDATQPAISMDGKRIMYVTRLSPQESELWVSDIDGRNKLKITTGELIGTGVWAADSFHLCFTEAGATYIVSADGRDLQKAPLVVGTLASCVWSADQKAVYMSGSEKSGVTTTWKWNLDRSNVEKVVDKCGMVTDADPSGRYLLSNDLSSGEGRGINEISISEGKCISLLPGVGTWAAIFSAGGRSFLYPVTSQNEVAIYSQRWKDGHLVGAPEVALKVPFAFPLAYGGYGNTYDISRDLSTIVFAHPGGASDLYLLSQK
jgi:DNA-binding winged helix-turn-helix (wHTH) protein/Tol biopolymer transport system component